MIDFTKIQQDLQRDEGFRVKPYKDTVGKLTIGFGRNLDDVGIDNAEANLMLVNDIFKSINDCERYSWFDGLTSNRKRAIINMMFNLGANKFARFKNMIVALDVSDFEKASIEALDSKWASQVGERAKRIALLLKES